MEPPAQPSETCSVLGFAPDAFIGDVYNLVQDYTCDAIDAAGKEIRRAQLAGDEGTYKVLQAGLEAVQQRNEANKAAALDRLESYARQHCLNVPVGLMLTEPVVEEAGPVGDAVTAEEEAALDAELQALRARAVTARTAAAELRRERASLQNELAQHDEVCTALSGVTEGNELGQEIVALTVAGRALAAKLAVVDGMQQADALRRANVLTESGHNAELGGEHVLAKNATLESLALLNRNLRS